MALPAIRSLFTNLQQKALAKSFAEKGG